MIPILKHSFLLVFFLSSISLFGQNKQFDKAHKKYKEHKYGEAIPLYEEGLLIDESLVAETRLAFCYRTINNIDKAEELYSKIVFNKKSKPITWFYYGEALMGKGKYIEAKKWFKHYTEEKPDDEKGWNMLTRLDEIQKITPHFKNIETETFAFNSDADDSGPKKYNNGIVFSSDRKQGIKLMKQRSGWTGRDFINVYYSELNEDSTTYSKPKSFSGKVNLTNKNSGDPTFSPDGKTMIFSRNSDWATKRGDYNIMLFIAHADGKGKWKNVEMLSFCNLNSNYMHPAYSITGDTLFFASDRPGNLGGTDIFYTYKKNGKWKVPKNLSEEVNTSSNEGYPFMDTNGKLFFCSKGHSGYGGYDIFFTQKDNEGIWQKPVNVGFPINSSHDDISFFIDKDNQSGLFASSRTNGDDDIYLFKIVDGSNKEVIQNSFVESKPQIEQPIEVLEDEPTASLETIIEKEIPRTEKVEEENTVDEFVVESTPVSNEPREEVTLGEADDVMQKLIEEKLKSMQTPTRINRTHAEVRRIMYEDFRNYLSNSIPTEGAIFILENIKFNPEQYKITNDMQSRLLPLVEILKKHKNINLEVGAHTESIGNDKKNMVQSIKRATAIAGFLIREGISTERLKVMGYGETKLLNHCSNKMDCTQDEHYLNQRIELKILK